MLKCEQIDSLTDGDLLWKEWCELMGRVRPEHQLFGPAWYSVWSHTWGTNGRWTGKMNVVVARDSQGILQGVLPIAQIRVGPINAHAFAGNHQPWRTIVAAQDFETEAGRAIGRYIATTSWPLVQIGPCVRSADATAALIESLRDSRTFLRRRMIEPLAITHTPDTWDDYKTEVLGGKFFRKIGYYERRTGRAGDVAIKHFRQPSPSETELMLDQLASIEQRSWLVERDGGKMRFVGSAHREMWSRLINETLSPNDQVDCWMMSIDGQPVSFCFTLTSGPVCYVTANNYDEAVKDHRTGSTLYRYMIEDSMSRGVRTFDFGSGELHYKRLWGASYQDSLDTYFAVPNSILGRIASMGLSCRTALSMLTNRDASDRTEKESDREPDQQETSETELSTSS